MHFTSILILVQDESIYYVFSYIYCMHVPRPLRWRNAVMYIGIHLPIFCINLNLHKYLNIYLLEKSKSLESILDQFEIIIDNMNSEKLNGDSCRYIHIIYIYVYNFCIVPNVQYMVINHEKLICCLRSMIEYISWRSTYIELLIINNRN